MGRIKVLDHGFIELDDFMGSDRKVLKTARVSTGAEPVKGEAKDRGLIRYLYRNNHLTPFEQCTFTFRAKTPIFIARQWFRSRTMNFNEISGRYTTLPEEGHIPSDFRYQGETNHQGSVGVIGNIENQKFREKLENFYSSGRELYSDMTSSNVAREQARIHLPTGQFTEFYMTVNLRNLFHFLELRLHDHSQYEIRVYAQAIMSILEGLDEFKWSVEVFKDMLELKYLFQRANKKHGELQEVLTKFVEERGL